MTEFSNGAFSGEVSRRAVLTALLAGAVALPFGRMAHAARLLPGSAGILGGGGIGNLLDHASDSALNTLGVPGAFYADPAVRIAAPSSGGGLGAMLGGVMSAGSKLGLTDGLTHKLNEAAGFAAAQAKPVFHTAISRLQITDAPGIIGKSDGATQYLHTSAGPDLHHKLRPMIDDALAHVGAFHMLDSNSQLAALIGAGKDKLSESVTQQALSGIFKYIAAEERRFRANPIGPAGSMLKGMF